MRNMVQMQCLICTAGPSKKETVVKDLDAIVQENGCSPSSSADLEDEEIEKKSEVKVEEFEQGEEMRNHLLEMHTKYVAKAFLYPDPSDPVHLFLMGCAKFSDSAESSESSLEEKKDYGSTGEEDAQTEESESPGDEDSNLDLASVLALLNPQLLTEWNGLEKKKNDRKRGAPISDEVDVKRSLWEENPDLELNEDIFDGVQIDPAIFFENAEDVGLANGLTDSKAKNKVSCVVCRIEVCNTARQRHVFMIHVKKEDMYKCPSCDYMNSNSVWEAKKHCTTQHGKGVEPISNEEKYKGLILMWNKRCFPDWKQKRPHSWMNEENAASGTELPTVEEMDVTSMIREAIFGKDGPLASDSIIRDEDRDSEDRTPVTEGIVDDRTCQLCWEESRYPGRHIAQKHLKKPLYECPLCGGFGSYEGCTVMKHIHKIHPEAAGDFQPISNLEKYADEIRDLQSRCFPNRPMKLVRPKESSRPRERHHCKKCGAQVAQSDRQRHVYHRHLQRKRIFECPTCNFASNYDVHRVKWHIKWMHKGEKDMDPISHENEYRDEIDQLNEECFPGWQHRRKPFWWLDLEKDIDKMLDIEIEKIEKSEKGHDEKLDNEEHEVNEGSPMSDSTKITDELEEEHEYNESGEVLTGGLAVREYIGQHMKRVSEWTCRLCLKEFKPTSNFLRHVAKDHLDVPLFQCPLCDDGAADAYEVKAHMVKAHAMADMDPISNLELHADMVQLKFMECFPSRKMKPGTFDKKKESTMASDETKVTCQECFQEMKTEDRQIHVYRHHLKEPRLYECPLCDFSHHACSSDVRSHIKFTHRKNQDVMPRANLLQYSTQIAEWNDRCFPGWINRKLPASVMEDFNRCRLCDEDVRQTSRHIAEAHLMIQLHQCPLCEYGAPESRLVKRHLKNNHMDDDLEPIANVVARRADFSALHDKCFPGRPKRLSNITISDEGRRTKCKLCSGTISRKRRLVHTLEKHMNKVAYSCSACDYTHNSDDAVVATHVKNQHGRNKAAKVVCLITDFEDEVHEMGMNCFPDWVIDSTQYMSS